MTEKLARRIIYALARVDPADRGVAFEWETASAIREQFVWAVAVEFGIDFEQALTWLDVGRMT